MRWWQPVRTLAQRSADAAKEIKGLIGNSVEKVEAGTRQVENAGTTMKEIVDSVGEVTGIVERISAASREQSGGLAQVNQAIVQMDQVVQQNAAVVEQAAAAAESMQNQAQDLYAAVGVFKTGGDSAVAFAPRAPEVRQHAAARNAAQRVAPHPRTALAAGRELPPNADGEAWKAF